MKGGGTIQGPRAARWLLRRCVAPGRCAEIVDDLDDLYRYRRARGAAAAWWYWADVLSICLRPALCRGVSPNYTYEQARGLPMLSNYFKVAFRTLRRNKGFVFINVTGLAVGVACCLLIALYIRDELTYDRFHENADRIYRVVAERGERGRTQRQANTSLPIGPALKADYPEVLDAVRARRHYRPVVRYGDRQFIEENFFVVDSTFLEVFTFPLLVGDPHTVLDAPNTVVLTAATARRYFGDADPVGEVITFTHGAGGTTDLTVTGILRDLPHNAHFHFDFLAPITSLGGNLTQWNTFLSTYTYVLLPEGYDADLLAAKLPAFVDRYVGPELGEDEVFDLSLQPLTDIRLRSHLYAEAEPNGSISYIYLFTAIAAFILAIGCVNFMNLATARSAKRAREVGLRKTVGARRGQLMGQFLGESMLLSFGAGVLALLLTALLIPFYADLAGKPWTFGDLLKPGFLLGLGAVTLAVGFLAGSYPAFVLSSFRPSEVLKGQARRGGSRLRRGLVVFQFVVSVALLVCTAVVYRQVQYVRGKDLGFAKEQVVAVPISTELGEQAGALKQALAAYPGITGTTVSLLVPGEDVWTYGTRRAGADEGFAVGTYTVDHDFLDVYGLDLVAGRNFSRAMPGDSAAFVLNEAAVRAFGWASPEAALGERLTWSMRVEGEVIGVVNDFHAESLHEQIEPLLFVLYPEYYYLSARIAADQAGPTLAFIEETLAAFAPERPFESFFIDQRFDALYRSDQQIGRLFGIFALLAIFVACLGLFGLAAFTAEQRTKEIGIRKVLGASAAGIVLLLSREVTRLLLFAVAIAAPIAYFAMDRWLSGFAYRVDLGPGVFVLAALGALLVAWLTVGYQSVRAALTDPVNALRYE